MRAYVWYFRWPGMGIAHSFEFEEPVTERQARQAIRSQAQLDRLPRGTELWIGR